MAWMLNWGRWAVVLVALLVACTPAPAPTTTAVDRPVPSSPTTSTVSAPSTTSSTTTTTTVAPPARGGIIRIGVDQEPPVLNPLIPGGANRIADRIVSNVLGGAYRTDPVGSEIPDLALELPTVRNGGVVALDDGSMEVTWRVAPHRFWSDGVAVTVGDFANTIDVRTAATSRNPNALSVFEVVEGYRVDADAITVALSEPRLDYGLLFEYVLPAHVVASPEALNSFTNETWPATGPFVVKKWNAGRRIRLLPNPYYQEVDGRGVALPYADRIVFELYDGEDAMIDGLLAGEVDVVVSDWADPWDASNVARLQRSRHLTVHAAPGDVTMSLVFGTHMDHAAPVHFDAAYRSAIAASIDLDQLTEAVYGSALLAADGFMSSLSTASWDTLRGPPAEDAPSVGVCESVDCTAGQLRLRFPDSRDRRAIGEAIQAQLAGGPLAIQLDEGNDFEHCHPDCRRFHFDLTAILTVGPGGWRDADYVDTIVRWTVGPDLELWEQSDRLRYEALLSELGSTVDVMRATEILERVDAILAESVAVVPLLRQPVLIAQSHRVAGVTPPIGNDPFAGLALWHVVESGG